MNFTLVGVDGTREECIVHDLEFYLKAIQDAMPDITTSEVARNDVNAALAAIYWKWGKTPANKAMDAFRLGQLGWKRYE